MTRANVAPGSPGPSTQLQADDYPRIHSCRWEWCRLTFSINAELVHHVIHDHVRHAAPVMRKDIPMLRRAEEGAGESMSGFPTSYIDATCPSHDDQSGSIPKSKMNVPFETEPSSSLPSPPASSPPPFSPTSSDGNAGSSTEVHAAPDRDPSPRPLPDTPQHLSANGTPRPTTPQPLQAQSTESRYATPTFASLSSPTGSPALPAVPASPSLDSLVHEAINGKRKREDERFSSAESPSSQLQNSQESQNSMTSSQDSVEKQLTQSMDVDDNEPEYTRLRGEPQAEEPESCTGTSVPAQSGLGTYEGELHWSAEGSQMSSPNPWSSQTSLYRSLPPLQTQRHSPPAISTKALNTPTSALPTPSSIQRQAWYGTLPSHPHKRRKSRQNPSLSVTNTIQSAEASGSRVSKPSTRIHPMPDIRPSRDPNSQPGARPLGNVFQSGTLQIIPTLESVQLEYEGGAVDDAGSQSPPLVGWSQTQTSWLGHGSYPPLQTQAPYQSQSSSQ